MPRICRCPLGIAVAGTIVALACSGPAAEPPDSHAPATLPAAAPPAAAAAATPAQQTFSDPAFGYSLRLPPEWAVATDLADGKRVRMSVRTPASNRFLAIVDALDQAVTRESSFETIGKTYVDPVITGVLNVFKLPAGARQTDDHSKPDSMRFWQGTSSFGLETGPTMVLSLHAIHFDSAVMVSLFYVSTRSSTEEVREVDRIMESLAYDY